MAKTPDLNSIITAHRARRLRNRRIAKRGPLSRRQLPTRPVRRPVSKPNPIHERRFNASLHGLRAITDPSSHLRRLETDPLSIVVAVKGCCNSNGLSSARGSIGVFFSPHAIDLNASSLLPPSAPQTSQYAALFSAISALDTIHQLIIAGEDVSHVVIKTDSAYLEKGLAEYVWKWAGNGFLSTKGEPVVNGRAFKYLHEKIGLLEGEYGIKISFCRVERRQNGQAEGLARRALGLAAPLKEEMREVQIVG